MQEGVEKPARPKVLYEVGELVRTGDGLFTDFIGMLFILNHQTRALHRV